MYEDIIKPGFVLFVISFVMVAILATINVVTKDTILSNKTLEQKEAMSYVMPAAEYSRFEDEVIINYLQNDNSNLYTEDAAHIYSYSKNMVDNELVGYAIITQTQGYGGKMKLVVGINMNGVITGVALLDHTETPGLGANADTPAFTNKYIGKSGILTVTKSPAPKENEIDAITASTITSEAVTTAVNNVTTFFDNNLKGVNE